MAATDLSLHGDLHKMTLNDKNQGANQGLGEVNANAKEQHHRECAACATPAKLCCSACSTTTTPGTKSTWYCGKDCQKMDWAAHKTTCKSLRAKIDIRSLKRVTKILHILFLQYRNIGFDLMIAKAERKGNQLHIEEGEYDFTKGFLPGYAHVLENSALKLELEDHAMLLAMMCCDDVLTQFHECCSLFLQDTKLAKKIKEVILFPLPGPCSWSIKRPWGVEEPHLYRHSILQVTLKDGSQWALDLTAAQYGHKELLMPWDEYIRERVRSIISVDHFGARLDVWHSKHASCIGKEDCLRVNCRDPADVAKAISWYSYQLAALVRPSLEATLRIQELSASDLLRMTDDNFETKFKIIVAAACEEVQSFRQVNETVVLENA